MGSSVKRKWSFFLLWALNPRSQGTMPTGMIHVREFEQLDLPARRRALRRSVTVSATWRVNNLSFGNRIHNTMKETRPFTVQKCHHSLEYWIIVPKIIVTHYSGNYGTQSKLAAYRIYELKATRKPIPVDLRHAILSGFRDEPHEFHLSNYFNYHKHKSIPIHSWNCELWLPGKTRKKTHHVTKNRTFMRQPNAKDVINPLNIRFTIASEFL